MFGGDPDRVPKLGADHGGGDDSGSARNRVAFATGPDKGRDSRQSSGGVDLGHYQRVGDPAASLVARSSWISDAAGALTQRDYYVIGVFQ